MTIGGRRTSVSLEPEVWDGLTEICRREAVGIDTLCAEVERRRVRSSLSSSLRVLLLLYFRGLAETFTETGSSTPPTSHFAAALERFRDGEANGTR